MNKKLTHSILLVLSLVVLFSATASAYYGNVVYASLKYAGYVTDSSYLYGGYGSMTMRGTNWEQSTGYCYETTRKCRPWYADGDFAVAGLNLPRNSFNTLKT